AGARQRPGGVLAEEGGVVHAQADERGDRAGVGEVVLQRNHRRQVAGAAYLAKAADADVVLERRGRQHLDAQAVADEVFGGDGGAGAAAHLGRRQQAQLERGGVEAAAVRARVDDVGADPERPVAARLGGGRQGEGGGEGGDEQRGRA